MMFEGVTLKKFKAKPIDGKRVEMTFQAQIYPVKDQIAMLANVLMEQIKIKIDEPRQQDLVKESEKKTEAEDAWPKKKHTRTADGGTGSSGMAGGSRPR